MLFMRGCAWLTLISSDLLPATCWCPLGQSAGSTSSCFSGRHIRFWQASLVPMAWFWNSIHFGTATGPWRAPRSPKMTEVEGRVRLGNEDFFLGLHQQRAVPSSFGIERIILLCQKETFVALHIFILTKGGHSPRSCLHPTSSTSQDAHSLGMCFLESFFPV